MKEKSVRLEMARGRAVPVEDVAGKPRIRRPRYNRRSRRSNGETATDSNTSDDVKRDEEPCEDNVKREEERCEEEPCDVNDIKIEVEEA